MQANLQRLPAQPAQLLSSLSPGDGGIRTLDPLLARQVLSQLSYIPMTTGGLSPFSLRPTDLCCLFPGLPFLETQWA